MKLCLHSIDNNMLMICSGSQDACFCINAIVMISFAGEVFYRLIDVVILLQETNTTRCFSSIIDSGLCDIVTSMYFSMSWCGDIIQATLKATLPQFNSAIVSAIMNLL